MDIHIQSDKTAEYDMGANHITCGPNPRGYWIATKRPVALSAPETVLSGSSLKALLIYLTGRRDNGLETWVDKNVEFTPFVQGNLPHAPSAIKEDVLL